MRRMHEVRDKPLNILIAELRKSGYVYDHIPGRRYRIILNLVPRGKNITRRYNLPNSVENVIFYSLILYHIFVYKTVADLILQMEFCKLNVHSINEFMSENS